MTDVTVVAAGYRSTRYWVLSAGRSRILVDLGWPGRWGDLTHPAFVADEGSAVMAANWRRLRERGASTLYPARGPVFPFDRLADR